jgi:hypothetical protein
MIIWDSNGVCPSGEHPHHGLATVELSGHLSLSLFLPFSLFLVKEGFSLGNLGKKLQSLYIC